MYIFKPNTPDGADELLSKSPKNSAALQKSAEGPLARVQNTFIPAQIAALNEAIIPAGIVLSNMMDSVVVSGVVSSIGQPAPFDVTRNAANQITAQFDDAIAKNALSILANTPTPIVPISSLSDGVFAQSALTADLNLAAASSIAPSQLVNLSEAFLALQNVPTQIQQLSNNGLAITVIDGAKENVQVPDFVPAKTVISENFVNTGLGKLTIITPATSVASLSLSGNVEFTATGMEVTSGITVSGQADTGNVVLYITGGASKLSGSVDVINLGDGNNLVFDAGNGAILVNTGSGANSVILTGVGVSGSIVFGAHNNALTDSVAIAPTGFSTAQELANAPLVTITGFNVNSKSSDVISFLGDLGGDLAWAGGSAKAAQVQAVEGNSASLVNWISAAQNQANTAHSIAWFHFDGATYILEAASVANNVHYNDTLVKLTGTFEFTGVDG
ncbi:MAG: hypothetical protein ACOYJ4_05625, partial [Polynucleobacter sp.]